MLKNLALLGLALPLTFAVAGCDVDVKDDGRMPDVDVDPGRMPDIDVEGPDVDIGTREETITVPDIDVDIPDEEDNEPVRPPAPPPSR